MAIHDVEPATWERCALIRDWLDDHGVDRVTLLVIPARDLHPLGERCPEMSAWLRERRGQGDSIAQHGFLHEPLGGGPQARSRAARAAPPPQRVRRPRRTRDASRGRCRLAHPQALPATSRTASSPPVTPTHRELLRVLPLRFRWWATLLHVRTCGGPAAPDAALDSGLAPAWGASPRGRLGDALAPALIRAGGRLAGPVLRLDLHPATLQHPREMLALESVLARESARRRPVTLGELPYPRALKIDGASGVTAERPA